jgi:hypothetical protein
MERIRGSRQLSCGESVRIGIPVLDELLGEIPRGKVLTYYIDPEVEGDLDILYRSRS